MSRTKKNNDKKYTRKISTTVNKIGKYKSIKNIKKTITNKNGKYINKIKTQKGGLFGIKHWLNMNKFNKLIKNLQKEEKDIKKYIGSYKANANIFKNLAENKRDRTTEYVLNRRQQKIIELIKPRDESENYNNKNYLKNLISDHDLQMIENKHERLEIDIAQSQNSIKKNLPEFKKDKITLEKKSKKFIDLVKQISSGDLGNFQAKIKLLRKEYDEIVPQAKGTLKSIHKKALKTYTSHKADYDKVIKLDETYIQQQQGLVHQINDLLEQGQFYIDQMEELESKREGVDSNIVIWEDLYTKIYELIDKILNSIKDTKKKIEGIKAYDKEIDIALHPIAQNTSDSVIKQSSEKFKVAQKEFENVIKFLDASASNINEILGMLLNEKMASEIAYDSNKIASAFLRILNIMNEYKNIFTPIISNKQVGGSARSFRTGRSGSSTRGGIGSRSGRGGRSGRSGRQNFRQPGIGSVRFKEFKIFPIIYDKV